MKGKEGRRVLEWEDCGKEEVTENKMNMGKGGRERKGDSE
jgi:hypothetical protein